MSPATPLKFRPQGPTPIQIPCLRLYKAVAASPIFHAHHQILRFPGHEIPINILWSSKEAKGKKKKKKWKRQPDILYFPFVSDVLFYAKIECKVISTTKRQNWPKPRNQIVNKKKTMGFMWKILLILVFLTFACSSVRATVSYDDKAFIINGRRKILISGSIHYPRSTPQVT